MLIEIEVTIDSKGLEVNPDYQLEELELHKSLSGGTKVDASVAEKLVILPKNVVRRTLL